MPELWFNYANLLRENGSREEAEAAYRRALELNPKLAGAAVRLARFAYARADFEEAGRRYRQALEARPDHPDTLSSLGVVLKDLGRPQEAIACWQRALEIEPRHALSHANLGAMYRLMKDLPRAIEHLRTALEIEPRDASAATTLAHALLEMGRIGEAEALARGVVERAPQSGDGHLMLGFAAAHQARIEDAIAAFRAAHERAPESSVPLSNALFCSLYGEARDAAGLLGLARELAEKIVPAGPVRTQWRNDRDPERRLRLGFLSADLRRHPVGYFIEPILEHLDPAQFEVACYSTTVAPDEITARLKPHAALWRECGGLADERLVELIEADAVDVLLDLSGHTALNRVRALASKPAPVQALYIGYPGTTGMAAMDWIVADARVCPPGYERFYSERVARLAGSFWCYRPNPAAPEPGELPALRGGGVTFGSYNALSKLSDTTLRLWTRVLHAVPGSRLVLKALPFADAATREMTRRRFADAGMDSARLLIEPPTEPDRFLAEYRRVDIALDPAPYNGGTTTCEALWMGVPVVTLAGEAFFARMGASLMHNAGSPELVAASADEYVKIAAALAADIARLGDLRASLRARLAASPILDGPRAGRELGDACRTMWREWLTR